MDRNRSPSATRYRLLEEDEPRELERLPPKSSENRALAALRADAELIDIVDRKCYQCYVGPEEYDRLRGEEKARRAYYEVLRRYLEGRRYDSGSVARLCVDIADELKAKTKELYTERYKMVASVVIGQQSEPSARVASRCLWDSDADKFHNVVYSNGSLFAVATVFGVSAE